MVKTCNLPARVGANYWEKDQLWPALTWHDENWITRKYTEVFCRCHNLRKYFPVQWATGRHWTNEWRWRAKKKTHTHTEQRQEMKHGTSWNFIFSSWMFQEKHFLLAIFQDLWTNFLTSGDGFVSKADRFPSISPAHFCGCRSTAGRWARCLPTLRSMLRTQKAKLT